MANLSDLSPSEYEKIANVLKRDRELRLIEETRLRQLRQDLIALRKRNALKPGVDPLRYCSRCMTELGRILNRGALCPVCLKKVCKNCREYGDESFEWLCIYCYKHMQLKAFSGEWMMEFGRLSLRQPNADHFQGMRHDVIGNDKDSFYLSIPTSPQKPPRPLMNSETLLQSTACVPDGKEAELNLFFSEDMPLYRQESCTLESPPMPRINPWTDIETEPTIPVRINKCRQFVTLHESENSEMLILKDRQSLEEGHCTLYSHSINSDIMDENEFKDSASTNRKQLNTVKNQNIPDHSIDDQQHSVETMDSGVFSPSIKTEFSIDINPPSSPAILKLSSNDRESLTHCLASESSFSETDEDHWPRHKISENVYKKRKSTYSRSDEKHSVHSADSHPFLPPLGLNHFFFHHNAYSNVFPCDSNFKQTLIHSNLNCSDYFRYNPDFFACRKPNNCILTGSDSFNHKMLAFCYNPEALCCGNASCRRIKYSKIFDGQRRNLDSMGTLISSSCKRKEPLKNCILQKKRERKNIKLQNKLNSDILRYKSTLNFHAHRDCSSKDNSCMTITYELYQVETLFKNNYKLKPRNPLVRSVSLPNFKIFAGEWNNNCLWKFHSLEEWQWCLEDQPYRKQDISSFNMLRNDYKLIYVSSVSSSFNFDEHLTCDVLQNCTYSTKLNSQSQLIENLCIKNYNGLSFIEDFGSESGLDDSAISKKIGTVQITNSIRMTELDKGHYSKSETLKSELSISMDVCFPAEKMLIHPTKSCVNNVSFISVERRLFYFMSNLNANSQYNSSVENYSCFMKQRNDLKGSAIVNKIIFQSAIFPFEKMQIIFNNLCLSFMIKHRKIFDSKVIQKNLVYNLINTYNFNILKFESLMHGVIGYSVIAIDQSLDSSLNSLVPVLCDIYNVRDNVSKCLYKRSLLVRAKYLLPHLFLFNMEDLFYVPVSVICIVSKMVILKSKEANFSRVIHPIVLVNKINLTAFFLITLQRIKSISELSDPTIFALKSSWYPENTRLYSHISNEYFYIFVDSVRNNNAAMSWRDCLERKVGLQLDDANAFLSSAFPLSSYATNRNDNAATGWGKLRCCIAVATQRVIDLNLRALECVREVLDSADHTSYLSCKAGSEVKLFTDAILVNAFSFRNPPVFLKPETDYLLLSTRLERCVLFQHSFHAKRNTRMIAAKLEVTDVSSFDKTDHENISSTNKTEQNYEDIQRSEAELFSKSEISNTLSKHSSRLIKETDVIRCHRSSHLFDCDRQNVNKLQFVLSSPSVYDNIVYADVNENVESLIDIDKSFVKCDPYISTPKIIHENSTLEYLESEILPCIQYIFNEFDNEHLNHEKEFLSFAPSDSGDISERVDCQCYKPCDVPSSPSVVDATLERAITDDGEILSSGDELDKLESDTDSQDTVIEGEAYKRIRSVAIKEKILHANEELFGSSSKEMFFNSECLNLSTSVNTKDATKIKMCPVDEIKNTIPLQTTVQSEFINDIPDLPLFSDSEESDAMAIFSSLSKHFQSFKKYSFSAFQPVPSNTNSTIESAEVPSITELRSLSSYCSFIESVCSSESSDNGSDGEEVILSDTSSSSDEATYIAPSAGFQYYSPSSSYKLHTIIEESCEETERCNRHTIPVNKTCSESEYYDQTELNINSSLKSNQQLFSDNQTLNSEYKIGKNSAIYAVLATSRLEKYFKSGLHKGNMSYTDDDTTDESGEVSSDDDTVCNKVLKCSASGRKRDKQCKSHKISLGNSSVFKKKYKKSENSCSLKSPNLDVKMNHPVRAKIECGGSNFSVKTELDAIDVNKSTVIGQVSDDEAKYIMNHLMQHITNNGAAKNETDLEVKNMSPMLKILESEIARLMLTVSPASLSAGEPSSSCSSTIGSNNSDYGSDTLESAEESTSEEEVNVEVVPENSAIVDISPHISAVCSQTEATCSSNADFILAPDSVVSEETLYICKQLMASLKKITVSTESPSSSDEIYTGDDDHSAKQYITDQIVSLMQTVNASHNSSPLFHRLNSNISLSIQVDSDASQDHSDSDSPPPNDEKRDHSKNKTPSESGSETTISASISIPSYDDSDRTPTESEISHEMDELYALLESNNTSQDMIVSTKFSCDIDNHNIDKTMSSRNANSPFSDDDIHFPFNASCNANSDSPEPECSLLCGAASQLENLLPISIEERIARYKEAFLNKVLDPKEQELKSTETRINVIFPQPPTSDHYCSDVPMSASLPLYFDSVFNTKVEEKLSGMKSCDNILSPFSTNISKSEESNYNVTSVKIISHNTYPPSSAIHKILSNNIDSTYLDQKHDCKVISICDSSAHENITSNEMLINFVADNAVDSEHIKDNDSTILSPMPKVMNPKEKASSENDLLVANYRTKCKSSKVFGTKSVGNICELENVTNKSAFRDTGYYSFKSSEESFLSLDESAASQTSTASLTQYRSLTSTETIPEEEESSTKGAAPTKISLSSSNIPDAVCGSSASKSSTLPLSLRNKLSSSNTNHRTRSSFFSTSGVLRKLTLLRDESGNSLRSSPHGRLRMRNRSLSGGSEDGRQRKTSVPQISVSECLENQPSRLSSTSTDKDNSGIHDEDIDQPMAYHCRSQMSLSSFGGRSESVTSVYSAAGGGRYGTVIVTGDVLFSLSYNYKLATLEINIKECRNLAPVDTKRNRSDPYVKVYLLPDRTKSGKRKTKVKKHTLNPVFDELLKFHVTTSELEIRTLWLSVWHSDRFGRNDFLGEVMLPLSNDNFESSGLKWYPLQERLETLDTPISYKGDLILALKYVPPDVTSRKFSKKPCIPVKGALEVLVHEARNLMATRSNGTSDPFCKSYLLPDKSKGGKQKTPVFKKSCNPKWNHTFVYDDVSLEDLRERCLELTIWDYDKITSNDFLGGVRLCLGAGKYQGRDVDWMDSVGEERSLWYTMLERPNTWVDGSLLLRPSMQSRRTM